MLKRSTGFAAGVLLIACLAGAGSSGVRAEEKLVGRIRVSEEREGGLSRSSALRAAMEARLAPAEGQAAIQRLISLRPIEDAEDRFEAILYDYSLESGFELLLDADGNELSRTPVSGRLPVTRGELADATAIVESGSAWSPGIASGAYRTYAPMPPTTVDDSGRRLVNVGIIAGYASTASNGQPPIVRDNEIVSVHIPTGEVVRWPEGAPPTSRATTAMCGPPSLFCSSSVGACDANLHVEWPAENPVWKFDVMHPACTIFVQGDGTGLDLLNVTYKDRLVLQRAHMPVLNVKYINDICGPYRDWLTSENCFEATGVNVSPGFRVTDGNPPPRTECQSGTDEGKFLGVAMHDEGDALWLTSEMEAGWYRYIMEWRLHLDGTIEPIFGFGATQDSCVCNFHIHHAYWRFEWAIDGVSGNTSTGINTLERRRAGTTNTWDPVNVEAKFTRPVMNPQNDWWRVRNAQTGLTYVIEPSSLDGTSFQDTYAKGDYWALAYNANQIDDPGGGTSINIDPWINGEPIGTTKRLVLWYHAGFAHQTGGSDSENPFLAEVCHVVGPKLVMRECAGSVSLDQGSYACSDTMNLTVTDGDLAGSGTVNLTIQSGTEPSPETKTLTEDPAGSGTFTGAFLTTSGPATPGDGKISVVNGDTITVRYVDASSCAAPNVNVERTAAADCSAPVLTNVAAVNVTGDGATITWTTNEPATSVVHYGASPPGSSTASSGARVGSHSVAVSGVSSCTREYFWVESTDEAGNTGSNDNTGAFYTVSTFQNTLTTYPGAGPISIPDGSAAASTITVPDSFTVTDVNVSVNVTHPYDGDLALSLVTPAATTVTLSENRGGTGDDYSATLFDDEASAPISSGAAPFAGIFRPETPLTAADGLNSNGSWSLSVLDGDVGDAGTAGPWSLTLTSPATLCPVPPVPDGTNGSGMTAARADPTGSVIQLGWDAASCPAPNNHLLFGDLANVASYGIDGGVCTVGSTGSYVWSAVPAGGLWFVLVGENGIGTEGTWGTDSSGAHRAGTTPSNRCGNTIRNNSTSCQ